MNKIATGLIKSPHGIHGYVKVKPFSHDLKHFYALNDVYVQHNKQELLFTIEDVKPFNKEVLIKFKNINTPEEAKKYTNWEIWIERSQSSELEEDEYFFADLIGCDVLYQGTKVGYVKSIIQGAQTELLEVETSKGTSLVPFLQVYIGKVSMSAKTVELLSDWLVE